MKKWHIIGLVILGIAGLYLWLSYFYIYYEIGAADLKDPAGQMVYNMVDVNSTDNLTYAALGDSLTSGVGADSYQQSFPYLIAQELNNRGNNVSLQNFSYPGYRTQDLLDNLLDKAIASQPDVITLLIGINDIHGHVSAKQFQANYQEILDKLTKQTKAKIYLISLPYIGADSLILPPYRQYYHYETDKFDQIIASLAKTYNLRYIDLTVPTAADLAKNSVYYSADKFHPSAIGYAKWAKIIYAGFDQ